EGGSACAAHAWRFRRRPETDGAPGRRAAGRTLYPRPARLVRFPRNGPLPIAPPPPGRTEAAGGMSFTVVVLVIVLLILVNALYVAAEFAAVSVRRGRIQQRAEEGSWLARGLLPHIADAPRLDRYIATCRIGITISSLVLG